jgi:sulfatase modifying factor 1
MVNAAKSAVPPARRLAPWLLLPGLLAACQPPDLDRFPLRWNDTLEVPDTSVDADSAQAGDEAGEAGSDTAPADSGADPDDGGQPPCDDAEPGPDCGGSVVMVTLDPQGGELAGDPLLSRSVGAAYGPLPEVGRRGHTFEGWWTEQQAAGARIDGATVVTREEDHRLYAAWTPRSLTVQFDSEGGTACEDRNVRFGAPYGDGAPLCVPARSGHAFAGWHLADGGLGERVQDDTPVTTDTDHTLHAAWTRRVISVAFDAAGGSACPPASLTVGDPYGTLCTPARYGHIFLGWRLGDLIVTADTVMTTDADHSLRAAWQALWRTQNWRRIEAGGAVLGSPEGEPGHQDPTLCGAGWWEDWGPALTPCPSDESRVRAIITRPFLLGDTEVTEAQWRSLSGGLSPVCGREEHDPEAIQSLGEGCGPDMPVRQVSWWSVLGYANALSEAEGLAPCYRLPEMRPDGEACTGSWQDGTLDCGTQYPETTSENMFSCEGYRLPSEAEWEYAARAGTSTATWLGDVSELTEACERRDPNLDPIAWHMCNTTPETPTPDVATRMRNPLELHDMLGGVSEWTWDSAGGASVRSGVDPLREVNDAPLRTCRGGSWTQFPLASRAASRSGVEPWTSARDLGFRLARTAPEHAAGVTLAFDSRGGTPCAARRVTPGEVLGALCETTRAGWRFLGWYSEVSHGGLRRTAETVTPPGGNVVLYARWSPAETQASMANIPPGTFTMGSPEGEYWRGPDEAQREVALSRAFALGRSEVTRAGWAAVTSGWTPSDPDAPDPAQTGRSNHPAAGVTWWSILHYLNAMSALADLPACYVIPRTRPDGTACTGMWRDGSLDCGAQGVETTTEEVEDCLGYRLPTEAEWEYAARAGTSGSNWLGDLVSDENAPQPALDAIAWWAGNSDEVAQRVMMKPANPWGLHDMLGNVEEVVWPHPSVPVDEGEATCPVRGGHFLDGREVPPPRVAARRSAPRTAGASTRGFRTARTLGTPERVPPADLVGFAVTPAHASPGALLTLTATLRGPADTGDPGVRLLADTDGPVPLLPALEVQQGETQGTLVMRVPAGASWLEVTGLRGGLAARIRVTVGLPSSTPIAPTLTPDFVHIRPGTYERGPGPSPLEQALGDGAWRVSTTLSHAFEVGATEVTQGAWKALSGGVNPSCFQTPDCTLRTCQSNENANDRAPVERISWWSALAFANAMSAHRGLTACYLLPQRRPDGTLCTGTWQAGTLDCGVQPVSVTAASVTACVGFRIPTAEEWEYAARAGTSTATYGGDLEVDLGLDGQPLWAEPWCPALLGAGGVTRGTPLASLGWYLCNSGGRTHEVGALVPNPWALHDMLGNVSELTLDPPSPFGGGPRIVWRGGSYRSSASDLRAAGEASRAPDELGLRLVRTLH